MSRYKPLRTKAGALRSLGKLTPERSYRMEGELVSPAEIWLLIQINQLKRYKEYCEANEDVGLNFVVRLVRLMDRYQAIAAPLGLCNPSEEIIKYVAVIERMGKCPPGYHNLQYHGVPLLSDDQAVYKNILILDRDEDADAV